MTLINGINDDKCRSSKSRSSKKIHHRNYSITTGLDFVESTKISRGDNSSIKSLWFYRFVRAVAVVIGLLLLAALPLSATVLLLAALPLVLKALDQDNAH
jgi:Flp pilus assembly protein TadB